MLDKATVESLARGVIEIVDQISAFYCDPSVEAAYQAWLAERRGTVGHHALQTPEG